MVINALNLDEVVLKSSILSRYVRKWSNIALFTSKSANKMQPPVVLLVRRFPKRNNEQEAMVAEEDKPISVLLKSKYDSGLKNLFIQT